ncbi:MAG: hypothetical protein E7425_07445 [Ruminococcaceae bacterium]|nr:hypothetical protein [Oscillospiraceae bacterium]
MTKEPKKREQKKENPQKDDLKKETPQKEKPAPEPPVCAICGKPITFGCTIDHVVPQAIYKWHESYLDRTEFTALRKRITSPRNTVRTHRRCNERKEESIVHVDGLHVSRTKRAKLRATFTAVEPYVQSFLASKEKLLEAQQHRCYICRAPIESGVLRRIDDTLPRTWDNACLICHRCNCKVKSGDVKSFHLAHKTAGVRRRRRRRGPRSASKPPVRRDISDTPATK